MAGKTFSFASPKHVSALRRYSSLCCIDDIGGPLVFRDDSESGRWFVVAPLEHLERAPTPGGHFRVVARKGWRCDSPAWTSWQGRADGRGNAVVVPGFYVAGELFLGRPPRSDQGRPLWPFAPMWPRVGSDDPASTGTGETKDRFSPEKATVWFASA